MDAADTPVIVTDTYSETAIAGHPTAKLGNRAGCRCRRGPDHSHRIGERDWDTRAGTVELQIPPAAVRVVFSRLAVGATAAGRAGSVSVVATSYLLGVSTRRVDKLVEQMGIKGISKSQVSQMSKVLDAQVAAFRNRALEAGPYTFIWWTR